MKKTLLLLSFAAVASMASAQAVVGLVSKEDLEAAGILKDKATLGPITFVDNEVGTFGTAYEDSWGSSTIYKGYQNVKVDDTDIVLGSGAVGNANPTFISYEEGVMSAGAVFVLHAKKDGWMTVFTKINPGKQYLVFEGKKGALSYSLGYSNGTDKIYYTTPHDANYQIDFKAADISKFMVPATEQGKDEAGVPLWENKTTGEVVAAAEKPSDDYKAYQVKIEGQNKPQFPYLIAGYEKAPSESTGFMTFSVMADNDYYISALGSKACMGGFVYTENEPTITFSEVLAEDGSVSLPTVVFGSGDAVEAIEAVNDANAPIYNMMGVRVNSDAKGVLIQNGKKFIRK